MKKPKIFNLRDSGVQDGLTLLEPDLAGYTFVLSMGVTMGDHRHLYIADGFVEEWKALGKAALRSDGLEKWRKVRARRNEIEKNHGIWVDKNG